MLKLMLMLNNFTFMYLQLYVFLKRDFIFFPKNFLFLLSAFKGFTHAEFWLLIKLLIRSILLKISYQVNTKQMKVNSFGSIALSYIPKSIYFLSSLLRLTYYLMMLNWYSLFNLKLAYSS